ncbi:TfuA-like protein [Streptomyces asoensis]
MEFVVIHVFVGPTLPGSTLASSGLQVRPPVRHGDLFDAAIRPGDTALIVDGMYHQAPALRHKEILAAMGRGVTVIGAASIGALRAAELAQFGMLGVGRIYAAYACGKLAGDDEVAVGQAPDGELTALTWPVVNLRNVLQLAESEDVLDTERTARLLTALRAVYYPQRTWAAVQAVCRRLGETQFARWLAVRLEQDRHFGDLKRADALAAVRVALAGAAVKQTDVQLVPAVWETAYFRRWSNSFARARVGGLELFTEDRLVYQQVFDPAFPDIWAAYLEHRSLHCREDGLDGLPLEVRLARAGGGLPADRLFHPTVDLRDEQSVAVLLAGESELDRQAVARYADALTSERRTRPGFTVAAVRDELTCRLLRQVWQCPEHKFDAEASARGLICGAHAIAAAKRLVPGLLQEMRERAKQSEAVYVAQ